MQPPWGCRRSSASGIMSPTPLPCIISEEPVPKMLPGSAHMISVRALDRGAFPVRAAASHFHLPSPRPIYRPGHRRRPITSEPPPFICPPYLADPYGTDPYPPSHIPPSYPLPDPYTALLPYLRVLISHSAKAISICARLSRPGTGHGPRLCLRSGMYTRYYYCVRVRAFVGRTAASMFFSRWLLRSQANAVRADSSAVPSVPYRPSSGRSSWICSSCHSVRSISYAFSPQHAVKPALLGFAQ